MNPNKFVVQFFFLFFNSYFELCVVECVMRVFCLWIGLVELCVLNVILV